MLIDKYLRTLRPRVGFMWHSDEVFFTIRSAPRYLFTVMDGATRFILSYDISEDKVGYHPDKLCAGARTQAGCSPRILVTDGLQTLVKSAKKAFWARQGPRFVHIQEIHLQDQFNHNNIQERLNGEAKDRIKTVRGFKSNHPALFRLLIVHHNLFREHSGIDGRTPAQAAGITIEGEDQWQTVIACAALAA